MSPNDSWASSPSPETAMEEASQLLTANRVDEAIPLYRQAIHDYRAVGAETDAAVAAALLCDVLRVMGRAGAVEAGEMAVEIGQSTEQHSVIMSLVLRSLGLAYASSSDPRAIGTLDAAVVEADGAQDVVAYCDSQIALARGHVLCNTGKPAVAAAKFARKLGRKTGLPVVEAEATALLAAAMDANGDQVGAQRRWQQALDQLEALPPVGPAYAQRLRTGGLSSVARSDIYLAID